MITNFSELHEHAHDAEEVTVCEDIASLVQVDVFVVEQSLPSGEVALDDVLDLLGQLLLHVLLHSAQQEGPQNRL